MSKLVEGRVALVTGAAGGIGPEHVDAGFSWSQGSS